jgi:DNA-binding transcriptional MerR regulator
MTVPDQTMTLRQIMDRYASGLPVGGIKEALWDEDPENSLGINPRVLDLVDLQELKEMNKEDIKELSRKEQKALKAQQELLEVAEKSTNPSS